MEVTWNLRLIALVQRRSFALIKRPYPGNGGARGVIFRRRLALIFLPDTRDGNSLSPLKYRLL